MKEIVDNDIRAAYHSCYLVDVKIKNDFIEVQDSCRQTYYIDVKQDRDVLPTFKIWLQDFFLKGASQMVTVFKYELRSFDGISGIFITKFLSAGGKQVELASGDSYDL